MSILIRLLLPLLLLASAANAILPGEPPITPLGSEVQVNRFTPGDQSSPDISVLPNQNTLTVWTSWNSGETEIRARLVSDTGLPLGYYEDDINDSPARRGERPAVATLPSGISLIIWTRADNILAGRLVDSDLNFLSEEFPISDAETAWTPAIAADGTGFLVSWASPSRVATRYVSADGSLQAAPVLIATVNSGSVSDPQLSATRGGFGLVWARTIYIPVEGESYDYIYFQRLDAGGLPDGPPLTVSSSASSSLHGPDLVALPDDSFLVAWTGTYSSHSLSVRHILEDNTFGSASPLLGTHSWGRFSSLAVTSNGSVFLGFQVNNSDVGAFLFDPSLASTSRYPAILATKDSGIQAHVAVAATPTGELLAIWDSEATAGTDGSGSLAIHMRRFAGTLDTDADSFLDIVDNCVEVSNPAQQNYDVDTFGDLCDTCTDTDHDDFGDPGFAANTCPDDTCQGFDDALDFDADSVPDGCDSCTDSDDDGFGDPGFDNICADDICEGFDDALDFDADALPDGCDTCTDTDGDGFGNPGFDNTCADDICEGHDDALDADADTIPDGCDTCTDTDGDGFGNPGFDNTCADDVCEGHDDALDADADAIPDGCDTCTDTDGDGFGDPGFGNTCPTDTCPGFDDAVDSDGDSIPDGCDLCIGLDANGDSNRRRLL